MVGKNNHIRTIKSNLKEHYKSYKAGTRWIYASLASLALGAGLLLGGSMTTYAAVNTTNTQDPNETVSNETGDAAVANQTASSVALKSNVGNQSNADSAGTTATNNTASKASENANPVKTDAPATSDSVATTAKTNGNNTAQNTTAPNSGSATTPANNATEQPATPATTQPTASKTLVDPTEDQLNAAKASASATYAATHEPQEIDAVAGEPATTAPLTISTNAVGYGTNAQSPLTLNLNVNAKAGDVYEINIPANTPVYAFDQAIPLNRSVGNTTTVQNADGSHTITDIFTTNATTNQVIKINLGNNSDYQYSVIPDAGKTVTKTITYSVNGVSQTPITFTQRIQPITNLSTVSLLYPDSQTVTKILPNQNYVFGVSVNEADGIQDDTSATYRVNSAVNYGGAKITIPVPTGFVLDTNSTNQINGLVDGSTITQPGGKGTNVIIDVPAGKGNQKYEQDQGKAPKYKLVGAFDVSQTDVNQTLTADSDVTFSQVINSDGGTLTDSADPWSVTILAANADATQESRGVPTIKGNSSLAPDKLELGQDASDNPQYLNSFGFAFNSAAEAKNAKFTITIPSGLDITSIKTPVQGISPSGYMPDTSSWSYTFTLADGTTETGTVNAGDEAKVTKNSPIRTAVFSPNKLAPGSYANDLGKDYSFNAVGQLSAKYDNGTALKNGDQLTSKLEIAFDANGVTPQASASTTQTIVDNVALAQGYLVPHSRSTDPGNPSAGTLQIRYNDPLGQTTNKIYEPTFYFVIPKVTTVASINSLGWYTDDPVTNPATTDPTGALLTKATGAKVSEFTADNGQTVVKIDYAGTGTTVDMGQVTGHWGAVTLANDPDALPGSYPYSIYIVSPTTKLMNTTKPTDLSFVENNPNAYLLAGENGHGDWKIETAPSFFNSTLAQGNQNIDAVQNGTSDKQGDESLKFYDFIVYTPSSDSPSEHNASVAINLPTAGKDGSQYTFNLTGPIKLPANYTTPNGDGTPMDATVLYSTQLQTVNANATAPDTTGYVTADQIGENDWSSIRSIVIQFTGIKANTSTGRIPIVGTTDNFNQQGGKTGYLQTIFYGDGAPADVSSASKEASITITGTSTVKARYHYVDVNGDDQYIALDDLSKTLNDGVDTFTNDYPKQLSDFSSTDQDLIPDGYELVTDASGKITPTIVDGSTDGVAEFGQIAQSNYDGDFVQYELVGHVSTQVEYIDDDNSGAIVGTPKVISGAPGGSIDWSMDQVPAGYQLAKDQVTSGTYNFKADSNMPVQIHLKHIIDQGTATSTRTITYTGVTSGNPASVSQPANWTTGYDEVTKVTTYTPLNNYAVVNSPDIPGYTPDKDSVPAVTNAVTKTKPVDIPITVTYTADSAELTVTYIDTDNNDKVVGDPETLNGTTDETGTYTVKVPDNYILAAGQDGTVSYIFKAGTDTSDNLTIKLAHKHTTDLPKGFTGTTHRTITYTGAPTNPGSVSQPLTWTADTDEVTGITTYTPTGNYAAVTSPSITGYTPDKATVAAGTDTATATVPTDSHVTVAYSANDADLVVTYIDKDDNNKVVGTPETLAGKVDETGTYTVVIPAGYVAFDANQPTSVNYTFKVDTSDNITISLKHAHTTKLPDGFTGSTTRTITYTGAPKNPDSVPQSVTWTTDTDEVIGVTTYTPSGDYGAVNTPNVTGYVPDKASVPVGTNAVTTTMPKNTDETVTYSAGDADLTVTYVDVDNGNAVVGTPVTITGKTDETGTYTAVIPDGYVLAPGQGEAVPYTFTTDTSDNLMIKLAHKHTTDLPEGFTGTTTRTITYTGAPKNPDSVPQSVTWTTDTDEITGVTTYTPSGDYGAVNTPNITGYVPDKASVPVETNAVTTTMPKDTDETVTYSAGNADLTVTYVDVDNGNATIGDVQTLNGKTDGTGTYTVTVPANYVLAPGQGEAVPYTFTTDTSDNLTIKLAHKHTTDLPEGFTGTTTRTITYTGVANGQNPAVKVQPITWTTNTDEVTGDTTYTPSGNYYEVDTPRVAGYTPDKTTVPAGVNAVTTTKPADANVTVTFKADPQSTTVEYVDDANNGAVVGTPTKLEGVTDGTASWNTDNKPAKYTLATGQAANGTYTFKAGDNAPVQIHLTHAMAYTTTTTTRTIHYVVNDPNYTGEVPAPTVQKVTWNVVTDEVTGTSVATPTAAYYEQTAPDLTGYTVKPGQVAQQALGSVVAQDVPMYNEDVVVTYTPTSQPTKPGLPTEPSVPSDGTGVPEKQPGGNPTGTPTEPTTPGTPAPGTATSGKTNGDDSQSSTESGSNAGTAEGLKTSAAAGAGSTTGTTAKAESQNGSVSQTRSNASATNQQQGSQAQHKLPQTNEQSQATVGLGVLGLLTSMLGLVGLKRRKRDDE